MSGKIAMKKKCDIKSLYKNIKINGHLTTNRINKPYVRLISLFSKTKRILPL